MNRILESFGKVTEDDFRDFREVIPFISWPKGFLVQAVPPFDGAVIRYLVKNREGVLVSIYFDGHGALGIFGNKPPYNDPYWEAHVVDDRFDDGIESNYYDTWPRRYSPEDWRSMLEDISNVTLEGES